jgi:urea transport system substrate-binding protein
MVYMWAEAAVKANSTSPARVGEALPGVEVQGPEGRQRVHPNHHLGKRALIGQVQRDGQFKIVHDAGIVEPRAWSQRLPENSGLICDWTAGRADAARFRPGTTSGVRGR